MKRRSILAGTLVILAPAGCPFAPPGRSTLRQLSWPVAPLSAEVTACLPHPVYVPTPLPAAPWPVPPWPYSLCAVTHNGQPCTGTEAGAHGVTIAPTLRETDPRGQSNANACARGRVSTHTRPHPYARAVAYRTPIRDRPAAHRAVDRPDARLADVEQLRPSHARHEPELLWSRATQAEVAVALRPFKDDKNVNPEELAAYVRGQGSQPLAALARSTARRIYYVNYSRQDCRF